MNINSETIFFSAIDKIVSLAGKDLTEELKIKIAETWKRNLRLSKARRQKRNKMPKKPQKKKESLESGEEESDSLEDYIIPECQNVLFGKLKKFEKKRPYWIFKINGCILQNENTENIIGNIKAKIESDYFNS
ncbi:hypothetical protein SteCoe_869 [Stentor coeruleus]|uniref:Uncharacterized protein n=1 Tax=Stentor coeruleus TaxID=5963 RepID=A0A1R2D303_9CILI|nr:hypothetical protein SteCoe_869 [Stentor coeruleus]